MQGIDKKRLHHIIDLIEQAERLWRCRDGERTHSVSIEILNYEGPSVTVIENVGAGSKATTYQAEKPDYILHTVSDPDFIKAEAHIMRLLEEPDEADI